MTFSFINGIELRPSGSPSYKLCKKLYILKREVKNWMKSNYGDINILISQVDNEINKLCNQDEISRLSNLDWQRLLRLIARHHNLFKDKELL